MPDTPAGSRRIFAVIDGNSLMHRAFHAVPPTMNAPDGRPTNAVFGFLNMFLKMVDAFHPDGVAVAFADEDLRRLAHETDYLAQILLHLI